MQSPRPRRGFFFARTCHRAASADAPPARIDKAGTAGETTTLYLGAMVEIRGFGGTDEHVTAYPAPGVRITDGAAEYLYTDGLSSLRALTDAAGARKIP